MHAPPGVVDYWISSDKYASNVHYSSTLTGTTNQPIPLPLLLLDDYYLSTGKKNIGIKPVLALHHAARTTQLGDDNRSDSLGLIAGREGRYKAEQN